MTEFGIQKIPRVDFDSVFDQGERYRNFLAHVNGISISTRGVRLVPVALDLPLGENWQSLMPARIPGINDYEIEAGNWQELNEIAIKLGIDLSTF